MGRKLSHMKAVDLLHQTSCTVPRKGVADFLRSHEAHAGARLFGFHHIAEPGPIAETFAGSVNPTVIPVLSDTRRAGQCIPHPLLADFLIRHLIPFCPLLFFSSEQYGLLLFSYERGNRGSVFSNGCSAGMSSLPCINTSLHRVVPFIVHHNRIIISKRRGDVNKVWKEILTRGDSPRAGRPLIVNESLARMRN